MADPAGAPQQPTEDELREVVLRGETLRQQLAALEQQRELIQELSTDARRALAALDHLTQAKDGDEVLVPLGGGAFVRSRLAHEGKSLSNLGSGVHAEVEVATARDRMRERVESLDQAGGNLHRDLQRVAEELTRINAVLETYYPGA